MSLISDLACAFDSGSETWDSEETYRELIKSIQDVGADDELWDASFDVAAASDQIGKGSDDDNSIFKIKTLRQVPKEVSIPLRRTKLTKWFEVSYRLTSKTNLFDVEKDVDKLFQDMVGEMVNQANPADLVSVLLYNPEKPDNVLYVCHTRKSKFDFNAFFDRLYTVTTSSKDFVMDGIFEVVVRILENVSGSGKRKGAPITMDGFIEKKQCIININNADSGCGYQCLALGLFDHSDGRKDRRLWDKISRNRGKRLETLARDLCEKCQDHRISYDTPMSIEDHLPIIQSTALKDYQIIVVQRPLPEQGRKVNILFNCGYKEKQIVLEWVPNEKHYNFISRMNAYVNSRNYCYRCMRAVNQLEDHRCPGACVKCHSLRCPGFGALSVSCRECHTEFYSSECFAHHTTICKKMTTCKSCRVRYKKRSKHECGVQFCRKCRTLHSNFPHYCFVKKRRIEKLQAQDAEPKIICTFDIETMQDRITESGNIHEANLLTACISCDHCFNFDSLSKTVVCEFCGEYEKIFRGTDCIKNFNSFVLGELAERAVSISDSAKVLVFAHNFRGFDGHFVLKDLFRRNLRDCDLVIAGNKILKIDVACVRFLICSASSACRWQALPSHLTSPNQRAISRFCLILEQMRDTSENSLIRNGSLQQAKTLTTGTNPGRVVRTTIWMSRM